MLFMLHPGVASVLLQMFPAMSGLFILVSLLWIVPAAAVYAHAANRNRDALLWALVTLVAGLLGVLLYVLLAGDGSVSVKRGRKTVTCPDCGSEQRVDSDYCTECGTSLSVTCPQCGQRNAPDNRYCPDCGTKMR